MANKTLKTLVIEILEDKLAEDIQIYSVKGKSPLTDIMIVASANNYRKLDGIATTLRKAFLHHPKYTIHHIEGKPESGWMVVDLHDVVIHLTDPSMREKLKLDELFQNQVKS